MIVVCVILINIINLRNIMRQTTTFTCGPASAVVIIKAIMSLKKDDKNLEVNERELANIMRAKPMRGTSTKQVIEYLYNHPVTAKKVESQGVNTYKGGVAIANIRNWRSGGGHYVVLLGYDEEQRMKIYDVLGGKVYHMPMDEFEWCNGGGELVRWSVNIGLSKKEFKGVVEHIEAINEDMVHIIIGENDNDRSLSDNASFLKSYYLGRGKQVNVVLDSEITILNNTLMLGGVEVNSGDTVWVKIDPHAGARYFLVLRMLVPFENLGVLFINPPSLILSYGDKMLPMITGSMAGSMVSSNLNKINMGLYNIKSDMVVVKRVQNWGGEEVWITHKDGENIKKKIDNTLPYILETDIGNNNENINSRVIWYKGDLIGVVDRERFRNDVGRKIRAEDFYWGRLEDVLFDTSLKEQIGALSEFLTKQGFVLAEISVANFKKITKVVVSNPGTIKLYIELSGDNFL